MRVLFMGTPSFAVPSLELLTENFDVVGVVTQPDRPAGRGKHLKPPPVKELALKKNIPVYQPESKRELVHVVEGVNPECIVVVAYGMLLPIKVLEIPPYRVINLHASLLPKYRGSAPIQRSLMAGENETGNTVMLVSERMDAGDILSQERVPIEREDNFYTLSEKLSTTGARLLIKTLKEWFKGGVVPKKQEEELATYAPPIQKEEFRVCWKAPAESVRDRVRALYPDAYTFFRGKRIKLLRVEVVDMEGEPGEVVDRESFTVACGNKAVRLLEVISPKGKNVSGEELARGYSPREGELLK